MVSGVSWSAVSQLVTQLVAFATTIVLARLLVPADFGIVGMAALYAGLVQMLAEVGLGAALIQRRDLGDRDLDTVFWAGLVVSTVVLILSLAIAPLAATFFRNPEVVPVFRVSSFAFVITALGSVHRANLNRELRFDRIASVEIGSSLAYAVSAVALALLGLGVWAMIVGQLIRVSAETVLLWRKERWRPKARFDRTAFRSLMSFGGSVWGFNFLNYMRENVDFLAVGRMLGATPLGFYTMAYNLANLPRRQLNSVVSRVAFPVFSRAEDDNTLLADAYAKVVRYISIIAFPVLIGLILVAPEFVRVVYGPSWGPSVLPLQLLCGAGLFYSIGTTQGSVFLAKGKPHWMLWIGVVTFAALAVMVLVGVQWGIVGVSLAVLTYAATSLALGQGIVNHLVGLRVGVFLKSLVPAALGCSAMAAALYVLRTAVTPVETIGSLVWLLIAVPLGAAVYIATLFALRVPESREVLGVLRTGVKRLKRRPGKKVQPQEPTAELKQGPVTGSESDRAQSETLTEIAGLT